MTALRLKTGVLAAIAAAAEAAYPNECCGLLVGRREGAGETAIFDITEAVPAPNVAPEPARHFEVDPAVLLATHRAARDAGLEILGPYHSHPNGAAQPSPTDTARAADAGMAGTAGEVWLIVPVGGDGDGGAGAPRAFVFDGGTFSEITQGVASETGD